MLMFGRVSRPPIDIIFSSVLDNKEAADYDQLIQSLWRDLSETMDIAQAVASCTF